MTAPARIRQHDIERACKAVKNAGFDGARILIDQQGRLEIIFGGRQKDREANPWDDA